MKRKISTAVLTASLAISLSSAAFAATFTDLNSDHWASKEVAKLAESGVIKGYPDGTFKPNNSVTRAEFATMVNLAFDILDEEATVGFSDVHKSNWFYAQVATAKKEGLFSGYPDNTFKPNSPITREEAAVVVANLLELDTSEFTSTEFADDASISSWAKPSIAAAVKAGVLAGYPDGTFGPKRQITRAESSVVVLKADQATVDKDTGSDKDKDKDEDKKDDTKKPGGSTGSGGGGGGGGNGGGNWDGGDDKDDTEKPDDKDDTEKPATQVEFKSANALTDLYQEQLLVLKVNDAKEVKVNGVTATKLGSSEYRTMVAGNEVTKITIDGKEVTIVLEDLYGEKFVRILPPASVSGVKINGQEATKVDSKEYRYLLGDKKIKSLEIK